MIDLTVKTLDSQNHAFSLADDITIREFKEHIADTVSVPADSQRLIYCGRVLQDEKRLSEYDVNGKVIHLVQRAPPQSTQRGNSGGGQSQGENAGRNDQAPHRGVRFHQTRTQIHGNPMYLGSISIPAGVVENHERMMSRSSTALARSRLNDASRMLDHVNRLMNRLKDSNATPADDDPASDPHVSDNDEASLANDETEQSPGVSMEEQTVAERVLGETSSQDAVDDLSETGAAAAQPARACDNLPARSDNSGNSTQEESPSATRSSNRRSPRACRHGRSRPPTRAELRGPPQMAEVLGRLMEAQDRLRPFLIRYRNFMDLDPKVPGGRTATGKDIGTVEENQCLLDVVSECLHTLSHVNHAISEIVIDVGQQPPRDLRRYPIMSQRSAIIQAGIPIQVEAHISVARNDGGTGENGEESSDSANRPPTSATGAQSGAQTPVDLSFVVEQQSDANSATPQQTSEQQQQAPHQSQFELPFGAILNLTNNIEVGLMEMGSPEGGGITVSGMGSAPGAEQTNTTNNSNNNNNNHDNAPGTSRVAGIFPWRPAPPPVVIRNLMNVVADYMAQGAANVAVATTATTTSTPNTCSQQRGMAAGVGGGAAPNPGQSTQARSNVGTHPTTSTRTRSTARPHVFHPHAHPLGVGGGMELNTSFDHFLVCDSHHLYRTRHAPPNYSAATSSSQQTSQPSQNTTPNGNAPSQSEGPSTSAGDGSSSAVDDTQSKIRLIDEIEMSHPANGGLTRSSVTLEKLLLDRGINITCPESSTGSSLWQRLFTAFARIELTEWFAFLETGKFSRDTWRKLRPHLTSLMVFNGLECQEKEFIDAIVSEVEAYLRTIFSADEPSTVDADRINFITKNLLFTIRHCAREVAGFIKGNVGVSNDQKWGMGLAYIMQECGSEMCTVLLRNLDGDLERLEQLIRFFATRAMSSQHNELQEWVHRSVVNWLCEYTRVQESNSMTQMLRMLTAPTITVDTTEEITGWNDITDAPRSQETPSRPAPEPMETEEASSNRTINDPLEIDDGQEVPTTFPGHEQLLPEWVPIIARDGIRQRRQLQLQSTGVTAFSDAYLDGLPSKRRKLVDQQKPRLLVSPTPNNSAIAASMERLVRDSAVRAGVEEADGAAAAVAADPGVRRAFGQAIRECFNPRRFQAPDFPDARRFPNATSYFTDKDRSPKQ